MNRKTIRSKTTRFFVETEFSYRNDEEENYDVSVENVGGNIKVNRDDFGMVFTPAQCAEVAKNLERAVLSIFRIQADASRIEHLQLSHTWHCEDWARAAASSASAADHCTMTVFRHQAQGIFEAFGAFIDPAPTIELDEGEEAGYDLTIAVDQALIRVRIGIFGWSVSADEAWWLAEHMRQAARLVITKQ